MKTKPSRESNGGRVVILTVLGLIVLFGAAYVAAYLGAGDRVPRGTTIAGVEVGGKAKAEAVATLEKAMAERDTIQVTVDGKVDQVSASDAGISIDHEASVAAAGVGQSWDPARLWDHYTGGDEVEPVVEVDEEALAATVTKLNEAHGAEPKEGRVGFKQGKVTRIDGAAGEGVDPDEMREALVTAYTTNTAAEVDLVKIEPEIDENDVQEALNTFANPAVSGPVTLVFDDLEVRLSPEQFTRALDLVAKNGVLEPRLDEKRLGQLVRAKFSDEMGQPVDATVELVDGVPTVIPSRPGVDYEQKDINDAFLALVVKESDRRVEVPSKVAQAEFDTTDAKKLRIVEEVSTFSTYFPHSDYRNTNLGRAAELIDGTVLKPGETFSMNGIVGERTAANGFVEGYIISNGILKKDYGGGVSQMATTLFNAMFFAGYEDIEHRPHSFYISRYPVGREATVVWGALDLKFRNNTDYGVLVDVRVSPSSPGQQGEVKVTMYSTDVWDITTSKSERYNFTSPKTRTLDTPKCEKHEGYGGFDIDVYRYFRKPGSDALVRTEKFHTTYKPSDHVVCE